jgi:hypothetical protein
MARTTRRAVGRIHRLPGGLPGSPGKSGSRHVSLGDLVSAPDSGASKAASTIIIAAVESGWDAGSVGLQKASVLSTGAVLFGAVVELEGVEGVEGERAAAPLRHCLAAGSS